MLEVSVCALIMLAYIKEKCLAPAPQLYDCLLLFDITCKDKRKMNKNEKAKRNHLII